MAIKLVYHPIDDDDGDSSPFEDRIAEMIAEASVDVACPYLSLDVLRAIRDAADSWRLVTDVAEWVRPQGASTRNEIAEFVQEHPEQIRDCRGLHAKTLVTDDGAFAGSANFTNTGLRRRTEVGVLFNRTDRSR